MPITIHDSNAVTAREFRPEVADKVVTITGTRSVGQTLTATVAAGFRATAHQWTRDGVDIAGATAATYRLADEDTRCAVSCRVTVQPEARAPETRGRPYPAVLDAPAVMVGSPRAGRAVRANRAAVFPPEAARTVQWERADDAAGTNAVVVGTSEAYSASSADAGKFLRRTDVAAANGVEVVSSTKWTRVRAADDERMPGQIPDDWASVLAFLTAENAVTFLAEPQYMDSSAASGSGGVTTGGAIYGWRSATSAHRAIQATAAKQPTIVARNGGHAVYFDRTLSHHLEGGNVNVTDDETVIILADMAAPDTHRADTYVARGASGSPYRGWAMTSNMDINSSLGHTMGMFLFGAQNRDATTGAPLGTYAANGMQESSGICGLGVTYGQPNAFAMSLCRNQDSSEFLNNGTRQHVPNAAQGWPRRYHPPSTATTTISLGAAPGGTSKWATGYLYAVAVIPRKLSRYEIEAVTSALMARWGRVLPKLSDVEFFSERHGGVPGADVLYSTDSRWRKPVPDNATFPPEGRNAIHTTTPDVWFGTYFATVETHPDKEPVTIHYSASENAGSDGSVTLNIGRGVFVPTGSDRALTVIDHERQRIWSFWHLTPAYARTLAGSADNLAETGYFVEPRVPYTQLKTYAVAGNGSVSATEYVRYAHSGTSEPIFGLGHPDKETPHARLKYAVGTSRYWRTGNRAAGVTFGAGLIEQRHIEGAEIEHALAISLPKSILRYTPGQAPVGIAVYQDGGAESNYTTSEDGIYMGSLLAIPKTVDLASLNLQTGLGQRIARACQKYGCYVVDQHGAKTDTANNVQWMINAAEVDPQDVELQRCMLWYKWGKVQNPSGDLTKIKKALRLVVELSQ